MSKEQLRNVFFKEFIKPKGLRKIRNILFFIFFAFSFAFFGSFIILRLADRYLSVALYSLAAIFIWSFPILIVEELRIIFSESILDGNPKTPSKSGLIWTFSIFLNGIIIAVLMYLGTNLFIFFLLTFPVLFYLSRHIWGMEGSIGFVLAGRVYTYMSFTTAAYVFLATLAFVFFKDTLQSYEIPDLGVPIGKEIILFATIIAPLTFFLFWTKERIFSHYAKVLISRKSGKFNRRKKILEGTLGELLNTVLEVEEADVDRLHKRAYLIKLKIEFLDKQIKEIEEKFEFHRSLTLNVITQPFWIVLIIEVFPRIFDFLR